MKYEMKIKYNNKETLRDLIEKVYFKDDRGGVISRNIKDCYLKIDENMIDDDIQFLNNLKGFNNITIRITNDIIDGNMRFLIDESFNELRLYPISIYCIKDDVDGKYIFF